MNPRISEVMPTDDYKLKLIFTNGERGIYDCSPLLDFGVFKELRDKHYFKKVRVWHGTVAWPHEQDICPDTLYSHLDSRIMTHTDIKIIDYDDKYAHDTIKMWRDSKEKALGVKDIHNFEDHLNFLRTRLVKDNKVCPVIDESSDKVLGIMAIEDSEVNQLYIHVDHQRMGIGSRLLNRAKELSPGKLLLYTFEVNIGAQAFYEKHGFKIIGRGYENEENLPDIRYEWTELGQSIVE